MVQSLITDSDFYFMLRNAVKYAGNGIVERGCRYSSTYFKIRLYIEMKIKGAFPRGKQHLLPTE